MTENAEFYFNRSEERYRNRDYLGGDADRARAIALDPDNLEYRWERGESRWSGAYDNKKEWAFPIAIEDLTRIIEVSTDREEVYDAYRKRALLYERYSQFEDLIADMGWLIEHEKNDAGRCHVLVWRGGHLLRMGHPERAVQDFTVALQISPQDTMILIQRARAYDELEQYDDAVEDLSRILSAKPEDTVSIPSAYFTLGKIHYKCGRKKEAFDSFKKSLDLITDDGYRVSVKRAIADMTGDVEWMKL